MTVFQGAGTPAPVPERKEEADAKPARKQQKRTRKGDD